MSRMRYTGSFIILFILLTATCQLSMAQAVTNAPSGDTSRRVHILSNTRNLVFQTVDDSTRLTIVTGDVKLRQGTALFFCDSCVINSRTNVFEAWGKVHIRDADTADIYSNHLRYLGNSKMAYLDGNVRLTDGKATLTTPDLEYDMETNIGTYKNGGRVVNKESVLTSREGYYYADLRDVYFKKDVKLKDPSYEIDTDSLLYNTTTQTTRFISMTNIRDSAGRIIKTREGFFNQQTGKAEFGQRPEIIDGNRFITGNRIAFDDSTGMYQAEGNAIVEDTAQGTTILGGLIYQNRKTNAMLATGKPLMIIRQDNDSIYISADTLFSARLTDRFGPTGIPQPPAPVQPDSTRPDSNQKATPDFGNRGRLRKPVARDSIDKAAPDSIQAIAQADTLVAEKEIVDLNPPVSIIQKTDSVARTTIDSLFQEKNAVLVATKDSTVKDTLRGITVVQLSENDSTNRYFEAYGNVRIFSDSVQSVCDSLFYSFRDSIFRLYKDPVVWAQNSQITGDTILLHTKNKKADRVEAFENSLMVNRVEEDVYNQVKSTRMDGWFTEGNIDSVRARSFAECIYYIQDEDSAYTGINQSQCDIIDIYFDNKELDKVVFRSQVTGTIWPIRQKSPGEMRLTGFRWLEERRPKTKYEMYE